MSDKGLTVAETAAALGVSAATVKRAERRARAKLAAALAGPPMTPADCRLWALAERAYLVALARCRPHEFPDTDWPPDREG